VIEAELVSRHHAVIECKGGHFVLVDYSTNGTWVTLGSEGEERLHRDQLRLRKTGTISLGQPAAVAAARSVRFECTGES
jgi:pSer/pThr/pTyr-binding forkhead associated (FHA) protein